MWCHVKHFFAKVSIHFLKSSSALNKHNQLENMVFHVSKHPSCQSVLDKDTDSPLIYSAADPKPQSHETLVSVVPSIDYHQHMVCVCDFTSVAFPQKTPHQYGPVMLCDH